ncbi:endonuclease/exonuclease/phosphatase family protein [Lacticaseibacillus nasuensis]|uniref:endonuclease/exonuclease/phosphatase family protein n=1 Tax=Lacticaseibacillus nasuensis TaxID=944671 RepID=UPI0022465F5C|nr:endonuclease/exonuclease/phosphatase family protein [Lacticaseibacillus nasuensis]MCX2455491.1 endonuclease/exonuclease/phosphatase family protein [Lacticaseibacillus nasuensis]
MKLMTYNIRYDTPEDGDWRWANRREHVIANILRQAPTILAIQEALAAPLADLKAALSDYTFIGVARDDGVAAGEFNGLFYRTDALELLASGHQWLSETPDQPSIYPGAGCPRVFQWGGFKDRTTGKTFTAVATHLDNASEKARDAGMAKIVAFLQPILKAGEPVLLAGDFNAEPADRAYAQATKALKDAETIAETLDRPYPGTFQDNGQFVVRPDLITVRIDYWFVSPNVRVTRYAVDATATADGKYASDHFPVVIDASF